MRKLALPILIAVGVTFLMIGVMWAQDDPLVLDNKYGKVTFSHKKHSDRTCQDCHHTLKEGETSPSSCGECHKEGAEISRKKAFHDSCKACHKKEAKGPQKCKECHVK
jgi:DnaJ-class molecular chaperone